MSKEIEVKVLNIDLDEMEKRLVEIGAELIAKEYQINTIFDSKDSYIEDKLNSLEEWSKKQCLTNSIKREKTMTNI